MAHVAQLVEQRIRNAQVRGSSPRVGSLDSGSRLKGRLPAFPFVTRTLTVPRPWKPGGSSYICPAGGGLAWVPSPPQVRPLKILRNSRGYLIENGTHNGEEPTMADEDLLQAVRQGARAIAAWRERFPNAALDLAGANLRRAELVRASLNGAVFRDANLEWADFRWADLINADLSGANLVRADFHKADLSGANLSGANLADCNLEDANCRGTRFDSTIFVHTRFLNTDLAGSVGLADTRALGPSTIDTETLMKSGNLPAGFLRGCGLTEAAINATFAGDASALSATLSSEGEFYSCFVSYSSQDTVLAERLHADLQARGVRCWFAPKDMPIGARTLDTIYSAIHQREKLLVLFSEHSVNSSWVQDEVERAFAEERERGDTMVFPVRIDDAVMHHQAAWARKIRDTRHIGDFRRWKDQAGYDQALERLLRDLRRDRAT